MEALLLLLLLASLRISVGFNITVDSLTSAGSGSCTSSNSASSLICGSLDAAITLAQTVSVNSTDSDPIEILLPQGTHYVTRQTNFDGRSVSIKGLEEGVTVACDYYADPILEDSDKIHTWFFNQSNSIELMSINFESCGFPFRFFSVRRLDVHHCTFTDFREAVLDVFNCQFVMLDSLHLYNNSGTGRLLESNRGNTGGIALGYDILPLDYTNPTLRLSNSNFIENRATGFLTPERAVIGNVYLGRGGGVGLFMNEARHELFIEISNCSFVNNTANFFGGGLFMLITSFTNVQHQVFITGCQFVGNIGQLGGAGVQLSYLRAGNVSHPQSFVFSNCHFDGNRGPSGGGIYVFVSDDGNFVRFDQCNFTRNSGLGSQDDLGAAIALSYLGLFSQRVASTRHEIIDCSFIKNEGPNGILSVGYAPIQLSGKNRFIGNDGASLRVIGTLIVLSGELEFKRNYVDGEGALYLLSFGQMHLSQSTSIKFEENYGRLGSCIVVDSPATVDAFSDLLFNPRCFIQYEDKMIIPEEWNNINVTFTNNRAIVSSAVYITQTSNDCSWFKETPPYFNSSFLPDWPLWTFNNNIATGHLSRENQDLSFGTTARQLLSSTKHVRAWPGQRVDLLLHGLDNYNHTTSVNARFIFRPNKGIASNSVIIQPQIVVFSESESNGLLRENYSFQYSINHSSILQHNELGLVVTEEAFNEHPIFSNNFALYSLPCPGGYELSGTTSLKCSCVDYIEEIVFCEDDQDSIILKHGTWAAFKPINDSKDTSVNLFFHPCPAGYCRCSFQSSLGGNSSSFKLCVYQYRNGEPDFQCICDREGILCGRCKNTTGLSVLLSNCVSCSDSFLGLIPVLVFIVAVLVVIIIFVDKPLPALAMPFIFYIQSAPYASVFFPETFNVLGNYFYYLSSATGFYFIYDFCLSSNLTAIHSYLLRYIPVLVISTVYFIVWLIWRRIFKRKSLQNHGSWWFIVLLYSSVTHTSFSILNCPSINANGSTENRWFLDGEMVCFTGGHIPLGLLAIAMTSTCIFFLILVSILPYTKLNFSKHFVEPFTVHYKDKLKFWSGVELGRRLVFFLALVPFPRNTVFAVLVILISLSLYTYFFPYKSTAANILDVILQLNLLALLVLDAMPQLTQDWFIFSTDTTEDDCSNTFDSISTIVYFLAPVFYLPLLVTPAAVLIYLLCTIIRWKRKRDNSLKSRALGVVDDHPITSVHYTTQSLDINYLQSCN